jgi:hypothetical protein
VLSPYLEVGGVEDIGVSHSIFFLCQWSTLFDLERVNQLFFVLGMLLMILKDGVYL